MNPVAESTSGVVALLLDDIAAPRLGTLLRGARKQHALTRRDVASRIGTTPGALRRYERGDAPVPPSLVAALAECYGEDLTAQFATRAPIQIDQQSMVVGGEHAPLGSDDNEVLGAYVGIVARLRHAQPGEPIALRTNDLVALSTALGQDPEHVELRIVELLGCTPDEARSLHSELLRRKLVLPVAGLVAGLAVITGVGVAAASTSTTSGPSSNGSQPAAEASPAPVPTVPAAPTTAAAPADPPAALAALPRGSHSSGPRSHDHRRAGHDAAAERTRAPAPAPTATAAAPASLEVIAATPPVAPPVITTDTTPMGIPANETVTIIQP